MLKNIMAVVACVALGGTAYAQHASNSRRTPVAIESLGGVPNPSASDLEWTKDYPVAVRAILADWTKYNGACRGGPGDKVTERNLTEWLTRVCSARDATADMMRLHGYCYGREGESGADHEWHACTSISNGNDYFKQ